MKVGPGVRAAIAAGLTAGLTVSLVVVTHSGDGSVNVHNTGTESALAPDTGTTDTTQAIEATATTGSGDTTTTSNALASRVDGLDHRVTTVENKVKVIEGSTSTTTTTPASTSVPTGTAPTPTSTTTTTAIAPGPAFVGTQYEPGRYRVVLGTAAPEKRSLVVTPGTKPADGYPAWIVEGLKWNGMIVLVDFAGPTYTTTGMITFPGGSKTCCINPGQPCDIYGPPPTYGSGTGECRRIDARTTPMYPYLTTRVEEPNPYDPAHPFVFYLHPDFDIPVGLGLLPGGPSGLECAPSGGCKPADFPGQSRFDRIG